MTRDAKPPGGRALQFMILIPLLTILVMALLFEAGLRIAGYNPLISMAKGGSGSSFFLRKSADPILCVELNPGYQGVIEKVKLVINSRGMRGRELPEDKDGHVRIALIGDSITLGKSIPDEEIFASRLERMLQAVNPRCEVLNPGTDSYDTVQEVLSLKYKGLVFAPDDVVVCYCLNDIGITPLSMDFIQNFIQPRIRKDPTNALRKRTWFLDQYKNPHESKHAIGEVLGWFEKTGIDFLSSIPKAVAFESFSGDEKLFEEHPRGSRLDHALALVQLGMIFRGGREGGFFVMIGRRRAA